LQRSTTFNRIIDVMVSVHASSVVDYGFEPRSGQTKDLCNWYLLLLRYTRRIEGKEQRHVFSWLRSFDLLDPKHLCSFQI